MTDRQKFKISENKEIVFIRDRFTCKHPDCTERAVFLAHKIAKTKANLKKYGEEVIHHDDNLESVCTDPAHNDYFNIGFNPVETEKLVAKIRAKLLEDAR